MIERVEAKSNTKVYTFNCKACMVSGKPEFISTNDEEINQHMKQHSEMSARAAEKDLSLDESDCSDIYEDFNEYVN